MAADTAAPNSIPTRGVDAVLPAGGRISGVFAQEAGTEIKALIELNGQTILRRTIHTLRATGQVRRIVVIGPEEAQEEARMSGADAALPEGATGPSNIFRGLEWLQQQGGDASRTLIVTTDLPFLTPEAISAYLRACPPEADIAVPIMTDSAFQERFPGSINEYVRLSDGAFTVGCVFLLNPAILLNNRAHIESLFEARKSQWEMAKLVGINIALRFLTRRLAIRHIVYRAGQILRCRGAAVHEAPPELAFDIDQPEEYAYVKRIFSNATDQEHEKAVR